LNIKCPNSDDIFPVLVYAVLFSNFDDLTKKKSIIDNPTDCKTNKNIITKEYSPSLNQGKAFNKFQNKITKNLEKRVERVSLKEGFQGLQQNSLTMQTKKVIDKNTYSSQQQALANLKSEYDSTLTENGIKTIKTHSDCVKSSRHLFQIVVNERNKFMELLNSYGVYPGVHYRDNTNYKMYKNGHGNCPTSHIMSEKLISLPLHMNLTDEDIDYVIEQVIKVNNIILQ
jgi:hypothetical protein